MSKLFKNWLRTLGAPEDPAATSSSGDWSAMSLLKAIFGKINDGSLAAGIAGNADAVIKIAAAGASAMTNEVVKRAKRSALNAAASAALAEGFAAACAGAVAKTAQYMKLARASRVSATASAVATAADVVTTTAHVASASGYANVAQDASERTAGMARLADRARKDRVLAQAAQAAAEAAAASVPAAESIVLPVQVFS